MVISITATCLLVIRLASYKGQELYSGLITELGNLHNDDNRLLRLPFKDSPTDKGKGTTGTPWRPNTNALCRDGLPRSSDEASVMGVERRG